MSPLSNASSFSFAPAFRQLAPVPDTPSQRAGSATTGAPPEEPPIAYSAQEHGTIEAFKTSSAFEPFKQQYKALIAKIVQFSEQYDHSPDERMRIRQAFEKFERQMFGTDNFHVDFYKGHEALLFGEGKRSLQQLCALLQNEDHRATSVDAVRELASGITACADGACSHIAVAAQRLLASTTDFKGLADIMKREMIQQCAADFIREQHPDASGMQVHYVNAYTNHVGKHWGLALVDDTYISRCNIGAEQYEAFASRLHTVVTPQSLASALADQYMERLRALVGSDTGERLLEPLEAVDILASTYGDKLVRHHMFDLANDLFSYALKEDGFALRIDMAERLLQDNLIQADAPLALQQLPDGILQQWGEWLWVETDQGVRRPQAADVAYLPPTVRAGVPAIAVSEIIARMPAEDEASLASLPSDPIPPDMAPAFFAKLGQLATGYALLHPAWFEALVTAVPDKVLLQGVQQQVSGLIDAAVSHGANVNLIPPDSRQMGGSLVELALQREAAEDVQRPLLQKLIDAGFNFNRSEAREGANAMIELGYADLLTPLVKPGKLDLYICDQYGHTLPGWLAHYDELATLQAWLEAGAELPQNPHDRGRLLIIVLRSHAAGAIELIQKLIAQKFDLNYKCGANEQAFTTPFETPLTGVTGATAIEIVRALLAAGADPNLIGAKGFSPLMRAVSLCDPEKVQLLLEHGADPNYRDPLNKTALAYAGMLKEGKGRTEIIQKLEAAAAPTAGTPPTKKRRMTTES